MPVALLLQQTLGPLLFDRLSVLPFATLAVDRERLGLTRLDPFNRLVALEETLIARAQSAFLTHWFGRGLPVEGLALKVHIVNIEHFRRRYQAVLAASRHDDSGPNLTEPLLGLVGNVAGTLLSPSGVVAVAVLARRRLPWWLQALLFTLGWAVIPALAFGVGGVLAPAGLGLGIFAGATGAQPLHAVYDLLGAAARLIDALVNFIDLLMGPRERIRNPLLRAMLGIFDGLARLLPFVLALVSLLVARLGPMILPLARQGAALIELTRAVIAAVKDVVGEIPDVLGSAFGLDERRGPLARLMAAVHSIGPMLKSTADLFKGLLSELALQLPYFGNLVLGVLSAWWDIAKQLIHLAFFTHPVAVVLRALRDQLRDIGRLFATHAAAPAPAGPPPPPAPPSAPPSLPGWFASLLGVPATSPPIPSFTAPDLTAIEAAIGSPALSLDMAGITAAGALVPPEFLDAFRLSDAARADFDRAATPPSVFGRARRDLERELGGTRAEVLARIRTEELPLRDALAAVVARVLPPEIRAYLPDLLGLFQALDEHLYGEPHAAPPPAFPVLAVPESQRLRVVVHRFNVRSLGGDEGHAGVFKDRLLEALRGQEYLAPAGT